MKAEGRVIHAIFKISSKWNHNGSLRLQDNINEGVKYLDKIHKRIRNRPTRQSPNKLNANVQ